MSRKTYDYCKLLVCGRKAGLHDLGLLYLGMNFHPVEQDTLYSLLIRCSVLGQLG